MNLRDYANHRRSKGLRGTSHVAVIKAIQAGRLSAPAAVRVGRGWEIDPELADRQWAETTSTATIGSGHHRGKEPAVDVSTRAPAVKVPKNVPPRPVSEAILAAVKAKRETILLHREEEKLLPREQVEKAWAEAVTIARTKLLAVPTRARQQIPHLSLEEVAILDGLIRETLEGLSGGE